MGNTFIAVEGQHDLEFICGLLKPEGFEKVVLVERLDEIFGRRIINTRFPVEGDLHKRVSNPMFMRRESDWVAVQAAGGETPLLLSCVSKVMEGLRPFPGALSAVGIVRDADDSSAGDQLTALLEEADKIREIQGYSVNLPQNPGEIAEGSPRLGIFVFPDNSAQGTIEDLLIDCGEAVYPNLIQGARTYVNGVDRSLLNAKDRSLIDKPAGTRKAVVACAANILKPGMSIAASIDQNRWLNETTRALPRVQALADFLKRLSGIS
ncbi:MAG: DUF3226 domain-containing protein [Isosphaeraceae bacterium]|jgi:hypothetical protein